jgi:hypothetical protein
VAWNLGQRKRPFSTRFLVIAASALTLLALMAAYVASILGSLDTPEFQQALLERASAAVGARIQARKVEVKLRGVTLEGVTIANPSPFSGDLAAAEAVVLRYRLLPLLRGRLEFGRLALERPVIDLAMDARGAFNYERLGRTRPAPAAGSAALAPVELVVSKLSVEDARIVVRDHRAALMKVDGADLDSSVRLAHTSSEGKGELRVAAFDLAGTLFVRRVSAPLTASGGVLTLAPVRATLAGGTLGGDVKVNLQKGLRWTAHLVVEQAQLRTLLEEARAAQRMSGTVAGDATLEGSGGLATLKGKGQVQVRDCQVAHAPLLGVIATALRVPELARPDLDECRATFTLGDGRLVNPSLSFKGASVQLTGRGVTSLGSLAIDYDMTLALSEALARRIPAPELRAAFKDRGDGFVTIDFKVTGTTSAPRSDLTLRVGKAAAESGLRKFLRRKLF